MKRTSIKFPQAGLRKSALACVLGTAMFLHAPSSNAQLATAEIGPSLFSHITNQINTLTQRIQDYSEYAQQAVRWQSTWQHYYQQIARFMSVVRNPTLTNKVSLQMVPLDFGVAEECGGTGGFSLSLATIAKA